MFYSWINTDFCSGSLKVLEHVPCLRQLSADRLSRRGSSGLGVSQKRVPKGRVFRKPLRRVCQPHDPTAKHGACARQPPHVWHDQPGNTEGTHTHAPPPPWYTVVSCLQHTAVLNQAVVRVMFSRTTVGKPWDGGLNIKVEFIYKLNFLKEQKPLFSHNLFFLQLRSDLMV